MLCAPILMYTKTDVTKWDNHNNWKLVIPFVIRDHDNCCSHIINNGDNYYLIKFTFFSFMCSVFKCGRRALELEHSPVSVNQERLITISMFMADTEYLVHNLLSQKSPVLDFGIVVDSELDRQPVTGSNR